MLKDWHRKLKKEVDHASRFLLRTGSTVQVMVSFIASLRAIDSQQVDDNVDGRPVARKLLRSSAKECDSSSDSVGSEQTLASEPVHRRRL